MLPHPILDQICIQLWDTVSFHKIKMMHFFFKVVNIDRIRYKLKPFTVTIDSALIYQRILLRLTLNFCLVEH